MACRIALDLCKRATEAPIRGFDLTDFCARFWKPAWIVPAGTVVRPLPVHLGGKGASGYQYRTTLGGQTGESEPSFKSGAASYLDGSVGWVREAITDESLERTIEDAGDVDWTAESPMTVTSPLLEQQGGGVQIAAKHLGGTPGETHEVVAHVLFSDGTEEEFAIAWEIRAAA